MKLVLTVFSVLTLSMNLFAETYTGKVQEILVYGNWHPSGWPAGTVRIYLSGTPTRYNINKDDPGKKEMLSVLLTAKAMDVPVTIETTGAAEGGEIRLLYYN